jgi:hypothetical protein
MLDSRSNHLSERVPLERIEHELGRAATAGATFYLLDNTANVRPVVMTTRALMELAWQADPWTHPTHDQASIYLKKWCREEFGETAAPAVEDYYLAYFTAPARYGQKEDETAADHYYQTVARMMLLGLIAGDDTSPVKTARGIAAFANLKVMGEFMARITGEADPRWQKAQMLAEKAKHLVPAARQDFFQANVLTQVGMQLHANRMLMEIAQAAGDLHGTNHSAHIKAAITECEQLQKALRAAEYGKWKGFYTAGDWLLDVPLTLAMLKAYAGKLEGKEVPYNIALWGRGSDHGYPLIKAYQGDERDEF